MTFSDDEIKERMGKYGTVYLPADVKETIDDIIGNEVKKETLNDFFKAIKKFEELSEHLKKTKLTPNLTVLLYGPPGTGKTSLTRAFAREYNLPMCVVESDRLVSPLLGDTIKNIRNVVELAAEIAKENSAFIIFFDEIDAIGSERSNVHEVGEIKRAVISFLQVIDKVNYEGIPLAIFGATNHQHQLDSAIWRRFTFHLRFNFPNLELRKRIIESFLEKIRDAKIGVDERIYKNLYKEYEELSSVKRTIETEIGRPISDDNDLFRKEIEKKSLNNGILYLTIGYSGSDIERGTRVALFKTLQTDILTYEIYYKSLELVGGTAIHVDRQENLSSVKSPSYMGNKKTSLMGPPEI